MGGDRRRTYALILALFLAVSGLVVVTTGGIAPTAAKPCAIPLDPECDNYVPDPAQPCVDPTYSSKCPNYSKPTGTTKPPTEKPNTGGGQGGGSGNQGGGGGYQGGGQESPETSESGTSSPPTTQSNATGTDPALMGMVAAVGGGLLCVGLIIIVGLIALVARRPRS